MNQFLHLAAGAAALPAVSRIASWVKFRPALPLAGRALAFTASAPALA